MQKQTMFQLIVLMIELGFFIQISVAETEYFPGLRKPPQPPNWGVPNENAYLLHQLSNIIEEQARRHYQQQLQQQKNLQSKHQHNHGPLSSSDDDFPPRALDFTYEFPEKPASTDDSTPFAISPADPRYYDSTSELRENIDRSISMNTDNVQDDDKSKPSSPLDADNMPSYKMKPPMEVKPMTNNNILSSKSRDVLTRNDLKLLVEQLKNSGQEDVIVNNGISGRYLQRNDVIKKHMEMDAALGMYVVALIAGVSAAVTVGLIAIGIGWYTLHKKGIAAADVEYPAYGVTGPNKEISPSGDRRLAQSAHMYHYQHQKQQIIAMENRTNTEHNGSLSDLESDDENEEGDYTVYECPGLAPTGEMEVKNPLFQDDPTPATPANLNNSKKSSQTLPTNSSPAKSNQTNDGKKNGRGWRRSRGGGGRGRGGGGGGGGPVAQPSRGGGGGRDGGGGCGGGGGRGGGGGGGAKEARKKMLSLKRSMRRVRKKNAELQKRLKQFEEKEKSGGADEAEEQGNEEGKGNQQEEKTICESINQ